MAEKVNKPIILDDKELIEMAMLEQFAKHHLNGDTETAKIAIERVRENSAER